MNQPVYLCNKYIKQPGVWLSRVCVKSAADDVANRYRGLRESGILERKWPSTHLAIASSLRRLPPSGPERRRRGFESRTYSNNYSTMSGVEFHRNAGAVGSASFEFA